MRFVDIPNELPALNVFLVNATGPIHSHKS
jgi:hypothetical protein